MKTKKNLNLNEGSELSYQQSMRLSSDAELLANNGRYSSATSLKILAAEEAIKAMVIRSLDIFPSNQFSSYKAKLYNHAPKREWIRGIVFMSASTEMMINCLVKEYAANTNMSDDEMIKAHHDGIKKFIQWLQSCARGENTELNKEMEWWKHIMVLREDSLYVRDNGNNKWIDPNHKANIKYEETCSYVNKLLERASLIRDFDFENEEIKGIIAEINWGEFELK